MLLLGEMPNGINMQNCYLFLYRFFVNFSKISGKTIGVIKTIIHKYKSEQFL